MRKRGLGSLGIAHEGDALVCAESPGPRSRKGIGRAVLPLTPELVAAGPPAIGAALRAALDAAGVRATRALIGVPAKWLLTLEKDVPPAAPEQALALLRLHAERHAAGENGEMIFDAASAGDPARATKALLVGLLRLRLNEVRQIADAAGLTLTAVTSTALAVASAAGAEASKGSEGPARAPVLLLRPGAAELAWTDAGGAARLKHFAAPGANGSDPPEAAGTPGTPGIPERFALGLLAGELRRAVSLAPLSSADNGRAGSPPELALWDGVGLTAAQRDDLAGRAGLVLRSANGAAHLSGAGAGARYVAAAALSEATASGRRLPVDFLHPRLTPPRRRRVGRVVVWAAGVGAAVVLGLAALSWDTGQRRDQLGQLRDRLTQLGPDAKAAQAAVGRIEYGRGYFPGDARGNFGGNFRGRPPLLDALRGVTLAFRPEEPIWATSFAIRDNLTGQMLGKAADQRSVLAVLDRLKKDPRFRDAKLLDMRDAAGSGGSGGSGAASGGGASGGERGRAREVSFSIGFAFTPEPAGGSASPPDRASATLAERPR